MKTLFVFAMLLGLNTVTGSASATVIYSYSGPNYTDIQDVTPPEGSFTSAMGVSGFFEFSEPLTPNSIYDLQELPQGLLLNYSFSSGRFTLGPGSDAGFVPNSLPFTDESGAIDEWHFLLVGGSFPSGGVGAQRQQIDMRTDGAGATVFECIEDLFPSTGRCSDWVVESAGAPVGTWSIVGVPEPSSIAMLALGLAGLGWSRRRK